MGDPAMKVITYEELKQVPVVMTVKFCRMKV